MTRESLNTGKVVEFSDILNNFEEAAFDFAEGDDSLRKLLLNCFSRGIITTACCAGHKEETFNQNPYIAFYYNEDNQPYIYSIAKALSESGFCFEYLKNVQGKSFISFYENPGFAFAESTTMFDQISQVIDVTNLSEDYFGQLPKHLQSFFSLVDIAENDLLLPVIKKDNNISGSIQLSYLKDKENYFYQMCTDNHYYQYWAYKSGFNRNTEDDSLYIYTSQPEIATKSLNSIMDFANTAAALNIESVQSHK